MKNMQTTLPKLFLVLTFILTFSLTSIFADSEIIEAEGIQSQEYLNKLKNALKSVLDTKYYTIEGGKVSKNEDTIILNAKGIFFSIPDVNIVTKFSKETKKVLSIQTQFSPKTKLTTRTFKGLTGKGIDQYFPKALYKYLYLKGFQVDYELNTKDTANQVKKLQVAMNAGRPWQPFNQLKALSIQAVTGTFIIDDFSTEKKYKGSVAGRIKVGSTWVGMTGIMGKKDYTLQADIKNLSITNLITSALGSSAFQGVSMPKNLFDVAIKAGKMTVIPTQDKMILDGISTLGQVELRIEPQKKGKAMMYVVGFSPPKSFPFDQIHSSLQVLNKLELNNTALVLASHRNKFEDLNVFKKLNGSVEVKKGFTFLGGYDLRPSGLDNLLKIKTLVIKANIPENPQQLMLTGNLDAKIPLSNSVVFKRIKLDLQPSDLSVNIGGELGVKVQNDDLTFGVAGGVEGKDVVLKMKGYMQGDWTNPMNTKGMILTNVFVQMGVSFKATPIPLPELAISGELVIDDFQGDMTVALNANNPLESMLDIGFNEINMSKIVETYASPKVKSSIPKGIRTKVLNLGLEDARMTLVPAPVVINNKAYKPGFRVRGKSTIMGHNANLDVSIDYKKGIEAFATMDPIRHGKYFSFTGARGKANPFLHIVLKPSPDAKFQISGKANVLGVSAETYIHLHNKGFDMSMDGKIFDAFKAKFEVTGGDLKQGGNFRVKATLQQNFVQYFTDKASAAIDKATKDTQNGITTAQRTLTKAQKQLLKIDKELVAMRKTVNGERRKHDKGIRSAENTLKNAKKEVDKINGLINATRKNINKHHKNIANKKKWISAPKNPLTRAARATASVPYFTGQASAIAGLESYTKGLQGSKIAAKGSLDLARLGLVAARKGKTVIPVDSDPRMLFIHGKQKIPYAAIEGAKLILEGGKLVSVGTLTAAKWIVVNGATGIVNVTYASFEGKLSGVNGGSVTLHIKGTYMKKPLDKKITFNFKSPLNSIDGFAKQLTK